MFDDLKKMENNYSKETNNQITNNRIIFKNKITNTTLCKFWLEGKCKKGDNCEYSHDKNREDIPECKNGNRCSIVGCNYRHNKIRKECQYYNAGYCHKGKNCEYSHKPKEVCINYLLGFCPNGPNCKLEHIKTLVNQAQDSLNFLSK